MTEPRVNEALKLRDGRILGYAEYGDPGGEAGFYFHGHPGSRFEAQLADDTAARMGIRIIALDRPGYGGSDPLPGRTILAWPADVVEAASTLGLDQFSVLGVSGGGPYALACAYAIPDRVTKAGVVSGVGPHEAPGATEGMRWQNRVGFGLGARFPLLARFIMWSMRRQVLRDPERVVDAIAQAMSDVDAETVRQPEVREMLAAVLSQAFRQGSQGAALDVVLLGRRWGFKLADIAVPVYLWQGEDDLLVPVAMTRHQAAEIPDCHARFFPGEGHLLVAAHMAEILEEFLGAPESPTA